MLKLANGLLQLMKLVLSLVKVGVILTALVHLLLKEAWLKMGVKLNGLLMAKQPLKLLLLQ